LFPNETAAFFVPFPSAVKRTMKKQNNAEIVRQQNHFDVAIGYYELGMFDESHAELKQNRAMHCRSICSGACSTPHDFLQPK